MSETSATKRTKAEAAVLHALKRVVKDPNFRYAMLGTKTIELMLEAEAERRGLTFSEVGQKLETAITRAAERQPEPVVIRQREKIESLRNSIAAMESYCEDLEMEESERHEQYETPALQYLAETWEGETA